MVWLHPKKKEIIGAGRIINLMIQSFSISVFFIFIIFSNAISADFELQGQASAWATSNPEKSTQVGIRYIPVFSLGEHINQGCLIDAEFSFNGYGSGLFHSLDSIETSGDIKPYRMWLRFSSSQYEVRIGLQKINFGSAMLLRPLMWFDSIDPRDPLQLTDGVYGILGRYYFLNNANIWLWGLYGNDEIRGWEIFASDKNKPEYGGRMQVPLFTGEIAVTYHHRQIDLRNSPIPQSLSSKTNLPENRIGLDGKWDIGIGVWFEGVIIHRELDYDQLKYQRLMNLGVDYTFDLGNGLNAVGEYFTLQTSDKAFSSGEKVSLNAVSLAYPVSLLDNLTATVYYDWENDNWYRFINWQRSYDNWSLYFMGFWNPDQFQIYQNQPGDNLYAGKGLQLMIVYNH